MYAKIYLQHVLFSFSLSVLILHDSFMARMHPKEFDLKLSLKNVVPTQ